jgi:hypothetical protein
VLCGRHALAVVLVTQRRRPPVAGDIEAMSGFFSSAANSTSVSK